MTLPRWYATLRLDPQRTRDVVVPAQSRWSAWWLARVLHPGVDVIAVRPVCREGPAE